MQTDKIILGIDPGTTIMGYGLIHVKGKKIELIKMGALHLAKLGSHELKLKRIFTQNKYLLLAMGLAIIASIIALLY